MKARGVEGMCSWLGWREKKQRVDKEHKRNNEHLKLFRNGMAVRFVTVFFWFNPIADVDEGEVEGFIVWLT